LLVDEFETIETDPFSISKVRDVVEIRANAFAAEFLAPQEAVKTVFMGYQSHGEGLIAVMETYGISFTSAKWQVANALKINPSDIDASGVNISPSAEWAAGENFTADYFPIESAPICRRGRFAYVLIKAVESGSITSDTAAASLGCDEKEFLEKMQSVRDVFV
jgi:hypothetical protein